MNIFSIKQKLLNLEKHLHVCRTYHNEKQSNRDIEQLLVTARESIYNNSRIEFADTAINAVIDLMWEECNTGHWSTVPETPKNYYAYASYLKVILCLIKASAICEDSTEVIQVAIRTADFGLMLGRGCEEELSCAATLLSELVASDRNSNPHLNHTRKLPSKLSHDESFLDQINHIPLIRVDCPSIVDFNSNHFIPRSPVVLTGCMKNWPALSKWNDLNYLVQVAGQRTVPIEIGSSYTQSDWGVDLTSLEDFISRHILSTAPKVGYLAQHPLFDQIPELRRDIIIPDYCCLSDSEDDFDVSINAWFGPANTLTPLHHDPKHNFLCQVVGAKQILLYSPTNSEFLYPHDENMLNNTAKVDPYNPDFNSYPLFKNVVAYYCTIQPGDMLYIPPKWWHHVKSLDISFSVSFWWE